MKIRNLLCKLLRLRINDDTVNAFSLQIIKASCLKYLLSSAVEISYQKKNKCLCEISHDKYDRQDKKKVFILIKELFSGFFKFKRNKCTIMKAEGVNMIQTVLSNLIYKLIFCLMTENKNILGSVPAVETLVVTHQTFYLYSCQTMNFFIALLYFIFSVQCLGFYLDPASVMID